MPYDVFVSYPHVDRGWVEESIARPLAGALKGDGSRARVFFDTYSIRGGSDWRATIDSEIRAAARFVPVWTKAYWESPICRQELETAMSCDPSQKRRFVVPVWDGNAEIPGALARLQAHRTDLRNFLELLMRDLDLRSSTGGDGIEWLFESIQGWDRDRGGRKLFRIARENAGNLSDIGRLAGHRDGVQGLACGPEPNLLVSAGMEDHRNWKSSVAIWEANTGRLTRSIACEHSGRVALSADGSTSLVAGYNLCSQVDLRSGREVRQLLGPCAAIFPNGQQAVTGTLNGMVVCYDLRSGEAQSAFGRSVTPVPTLWQRIRRRRPASIVVAHDSSVSGLAVTPDGARIFSKDWSGTLKCWDCATRTEKSARRIPSFQYSPIVMAPDGGALYWDGGRLDIETDEVRQFRAAESTGHVHDVAVSNDGSLVALAASESGLVVIDASTGQTLFQKSDFEDILWTVAFSPDQRRIFCGGGHQREHDWLSTGIYVLGVVGSVV